MTLENISQVLLRNIDDLSAKKPLLVNLYADDLIAKYKEHFTTSDVHYFTTNFEQHSKVAARYPEIKNTFAAQYHLAHDDDAAEKLQHDLVIMAFPKSKAEFNFTLAMLAVNLMPNAQIFVVGENKGGIKSIAKLAVEKLHNITKLDSARHCSLFRAIKTKELEPFVIDDWLLNYSVTVADTNLNVASLPGVFSQKELDVGTKLLLENLPNNLTGSILDFGCGAGVIASFIGLNTRSKNKLTLADLSALALYSAEKTLSLNNLSGEFVATNSLSNVTGKYDVVVSNPPFHKGIKTHYLATETFLSTVKRHMSSAAHLFVVANSFLKYQPIIDASIAKSQILAKRNGFTIYQAIVRK